MSRVRRRVPLLVLALVTVLAACGDDGGDDAGDDASAPLATDAASEDEADDGEPEEEPEPITDEDADDEGADGDTDGAGDAAADQPEADEEADSTGGDGAAGTVTVDGVAYGIDTVRRCEPLEVAGFVYDLEVQGLGSDGDERVQIDVYTGGILDVDASWAGPEGIFGIGAGGAATADASDDRLTGSATLEDAMGAGDTIAIEWDLALPADEIACR